MSWLTGVCPGPWYRVRRERRGSRGFLMPTEIVTIIKQRDPRQVIGEAIDLLMDTEDVSREAAFELLVQDSWSGPRRRVREAAAEMITAGGR